MLVITATIAALRYTTRISSTKKQFRERAVGELREIGEQVQGLTTDRKLYPSFETEVITANPGLAHSSNPYLALIRGCYTKATTMRAPSPAGSRRGPLVTSVNSQISEYEELLHDKLTGKELNADLTELDNLHATLKCYYWIVADSSSMWSPAPATMRWRSLLTVWMRAK